MTLSHYLGLTGLIFALAGCGRDDVTVQRVPKESGGVPAAPSQPAPAANPGAQPGGQAQLHWSLPGGWEAKSPGQMRAASFNVRGGNGQAADVSVIPLPGGGAAMELANLDMWRNELKVGSTEKIEPAAVAIGSGQGKLFEIAGGELPGRILVATIDRDGTTWYFKMKGDDSLVREQKPVFIEFLKSIGFASSPAIAGTTVVPPAASATADSKPAGTLPTGWQEAPPTQFALARYLIQGSGDAKAEMTVSPLPATGGGLLTNVNRWRAQLGLSRVSETDLGAQELEVATGKAHLVDMSGTDVRTGKKSRTIGVVAPHGDKTWFYKLTGDEQIVEQQKEAFTKFVKTADYSHVH